MAGSDAFSRYLCLAVDVRRYSANQPLGQARVQADLVDLLQGAAEAAGLDRERWIRQAQGDGELALIPPSEPEARIVGDFVRELDLRLHRHNYDRPDRLRLRLALTDGLVRPDAANGYAGAPVTVVSRLIDSLPVREALEAAPVANLAVIVSDGVYSDLVAAGLAGVDPGVFRPVQVQVKEYSGQAWLRVPGTNVRALPLPAADAPPAAAGAATPPPGGSGPQAVTTFNGPVNAPGSVIGVRNG